MATLSSPSIGGLDRDLFLQHHAPMIVNQVMKFSNPSQFPLAIAQVIVSYVSSNNNVFGAQEWIKYFGVDVVDAVPNLSPSKFYKFWWGPDPIDSSKQVCETHIPPVLRPRLIKTIDTQIQSKYIPHTLSRLIQNPKEGYASKLVHNERHFTHVFTDEQLFDETKPICWLVMRKDVFARNKSYSEQTAEIVKLNQTAKVNYEEDPFAIDLSTVVLTQYVMTGNRYLGSANGVEQNLTYAFTKETYDIGRYKSSTMVRLAIGAFSSSSTADKKGSLFTISRQETHEAEPTIGIPLIKKVGSRQESTCCCM